MLTALIIELPETLDEQLSQAAKRAQTSKEALAKLAVQESLARPTNKAPAQQNQLYLLPRRLSGVRDSARASSTAASWTRSL
ncbi:MAG: hypothetical protein H0T45_05005 [Pyrinomonadaceae bacterium]|nr:hypothetical protein [Pyrinomonadaceae bacterium]